MQYGLLFHICLCYAQNLLWGGFEFSVLEVIRNFSFLWFLGCILLCQFTFSTLSYLLHKIKLIGIALLVCSLIIFLIVSGGYLNVFHFLFLWSFYIAGYFLKYIDIKSGLQKWSVRLSVIFCSMLVLVAGYRFKTEWTFYNSLNCISGKEIEYLGFVIARYILYFAATLSALCFLLLLYDKIGSKFNNIVGYGRKTLFFYVVHVTVLFYTLRLIVSAITEEKGILVNHPVIRYYVIATLITAFVIAIMDKLYTIIEQWKYGSKILLGK